MISQKPPKPKETELSPAEDSDLQIVNDLDKRISSHKKNISMPSYPIREETVQNEYFVGFPETQDKANVNAESPGPLPEFSSSFLYGDSGIKEAKLAKKLQEI